MMFFLFFHSAIYGLSLIITSLIYAIYLLFLDQIGLKLDLGRNYVFFHVSEIQFICFFGEIRGFLNDMFDI